MADTTIKRRAFVTHQQGSCKWQDRHALVEYEPVQRKRDGRYIWKRTQCLNDKVRPNQVTGKVGSLQNVPLTVDECALWVFYNSTLIKASGVVVTQ